MNCKNNNFNTFYNIKHLSGFPNSQSLNQSSVQLTRQLKPFLIFINKNNNDADNPHRNRRTVKGQEGAIKNKTHDEVQENAETHFRERPCQLKTHVYLQ